MTRSPFARLGGRAHTVQWAFLVLLSILFVVIAESLHLPAALLLGPMIAAIVIGASEATIRIPAYPFIAAQGVIGCMIGHSVPLSIFSELVRDWPLFLLGVTSVIVAASGLGWLLTRWAVLPGTTAIWGTSPGASTAMILMSESYGADIRLVAVMQYLRIACVVIIAALVARLWGLSTGQPAPAAITWFPAIPWLSFLGTIGVIGGSIALATILRAPAGMLLLPLIVGMVVQEMGWVAITLPPWLLAICYTLVGWSIGLRFTRPILAHALRALPSILISTLILIAICGIIAAILVVTAGIDPLTAYLATSPGGVDSIAIIAATSNADLRFVMAMQTARILVVLLTSAHIARFIVKRTSPPAAQ